MTRVARRADMRDGRDQATFSETLARARLTVHSRAFAPPRDRPNAPMSSTPPTVGSGSNGGDSERAAERETGLRKQARFYYAHRDLGSRIPWPRLASADVIDAPPAMALCYVPYYSSCPDRGGWPSFRWPPRWCAVRYLFGTGNKIPPVPLSLRPERARHAGVEVALTGTPVDSLTTHLLSREFRACAWVRVRLSRRGGNTRVAAVLRTVMGYTPPYGVPPAERGDAAYREGNAVALRPTVDWKPFGMSISLMYWFRIKAEFARLGNTIAFGEGVPYMRLTVRYEVDFLRFPMFRAQFFGTYVPSASYQLGLGKHHSYEMEDAQRPDILATFKAGHGRAGPMRRDAPQLVEGYNRGT